jgi:cytochrome c oxidase assembly factor CtaG
MRWWCSQFMEPWSWTPRPYLGVWLIAGLLIWTRWRALRRRRASTGTIGVTTRQRWWFWLGLFAFWAASDWPVGPLGAGYLASVHMAQYLIYTIIAAPLFVLASPEWWVRQVLARRRLYRVVAWASRPLYAAIIANAILLGTHAPWTVDTFRSTQIGSFALDAIWFVGGVAMWLPVISPLHEHRVASPPLRCAYLFAAAGLTPMVPGGFLTFSRAPLYRSYEIAPRVGLDALDDQQLAGALMKVGAVPVIWIVIAAIWIKWANGERRPDMSYRRPQPTPDAPAG